MNSFFQKHHRLLFYFSWLVLALVQSSATELIADEAYYWIYSKFPAWGYFDHPPMIAVLIKTGYIIFHNELGVRLICALLSTFTILITESLTERKNPFLFYTIVLSIGVLQIAGFLAVPDTPLLFFTALFFYVYRSYLKNLNWQNALLLGFVVALLFYTKYHGLLIVVFVVLSNIKLLTKWQTWLAGISVLILYAPHLIWQWNHDWVSFRYHLFESNVSAYEITNTSDYLLGQLLLPGPLAGFIFLPAAFLYRSKNVLERGLKFTMYGIYFVFLLSSFRGKVEANWTMPALIPLIILSHQFLLQKNLWIKPLRIISFISLLLIILGRIYLILDIGSDNTVKKRFHGNRDWVKSISAKTNDVPVVFYNSYQRASLFWFYSGVPSHSHNSYDQRRNNYNFWPTENQLLGKQVFVADIYEIDRYTDSVKTKKGMVGLLKDSLYAALGQITIFPEDKKIIVENTKRISVKCDRKFTRQYWSFLWEHRELKTELYAGIFNVKNLIKEINTGIDIHQVVNSGDNFNVPLDLNNIPAGNYILRFGIKSKDYLITHNSEKIDLLIK